METDEYIEPERRARVILGAVIVAGALLLCIGLPLLDIISVIDPKASLETLQAQARHLRVISGVSLVGLAITTFGVSWYFGKVGISILQSSQCPHPDAWVIRRTRVRRGAAARWAGWGSMAIAVLVWSPVVVLFGLWSVPLYGST